MSLENSKVHYFGEWNFVTKTRSRIRKGRRKMRRPTKSLQRKGWPAYDSFLVAVGHVNCELKA
jgi:hypothetical protein